MPRRSSLSLLALLGMLIAAAAGAQSAPPPASSPARRPTVLERPWTTTPGSPYDRAQAVAAERAAQQTVPTLDFPVVDAPPADDLAGDAARSEGTKAVTSPGRPSVAERAWTRKANTYARAQAVAAERLQPQAGPSGSSPYPDEYRSAVPAPFQPPADDFRWRGGLLFPALPFPAIGARRGPHGLLPRGGRRFQSGAHWR